MPQEQLTNSAHWAEHSLQHILNSQHSADALVLEGLGGVDWQDSASMVACKESVGGPQWVCFFMFF